MMPQSLDFEDDDGSVTEYYRTFTTEIRQGEELLTHEQDE
jgi:hypothetical protein